MSNYKIKKGSSFFFVSAIIILVLRCVIFAQTPPYPPSSVIDSVVWDFNSNIRLAEESDLFPVTWADDDNLYTAWGDGWGFEDIGVGSKVYLGISRLVGSPPNLTATDLWELSFWPNPWQDIGKCNAGIVSIQGTLYIYIEKEGTWDKCRLWKSTDHGSSWTNEGWIFEEAGNAFASPAVINYGKNYAGSRDNYVYMYTERGGNGNQLFLARVHKDSMADRNAYDFYSGAGSNWSDDIADKAAVFTNNAGILWGGDCSYHAQTQRYLLTVRHNTNSGWGIFDAPEPWGPWTTVEYYPSGWKDNEEKYNFNFNQKWTSASGDTLWMVYSGVGVYDSFNAIKATLILSTPPDSTPPSIPQGLNAIPVSDSQINLDWQASNDPESGISHYKIFREGNFIGQSSDTLYNDTGLVENTTYLYEVSAVNGAGLESDRSTAVSATTLPDTTPPTIVTAGIGGNLTEVIVQFSEAVEEISATNTSNYSIDNGITIFLASLESDLKTVILGTSPHSISVTYTLTVNNVLDRASNPNPITSNTQVTYFVSLRVNVTNLMVSSGEPYEVVYGLSNGNIVYIDRNFTYSDISAFLTGDYVTYIKTANDDKLSQGNNFLNFNIDQNAIVYVAHDDRYLTKPDWLMSFSKTSNSLKVDNQLFSLFMKPFPVGQVVLGGNVHPSEPENNSMYTVIIVVQSGNINPPSAPTNLTITK